MSRCCDVCGKSALSGHAVARRGKPRKQGGAGTRVLGRLHRKQQPNLQRVKVALDGRARTLRVCTKCLKAGKVARPA